MSLGSPPKTRLLRVSGCDRLRVGCLNGFFREGCRDSRRCSRDTYPESYITKYTSVTKKTRLVGNPFATPFSLKLDTSPDETPQPPQP